MQLFLCPCTIQGFIARRHFVGYNPEINVYENEPEVEDNDLVKPGQERFMDSVKLHFSYTPFSGPAQRKIRDNPLIFWDADVRAGSRTYLQ